MELDRSSTDPAEGLPAVTVIVPTRDRSRYLGEAIHSVLGQTFADLELFVIDDGSTHDTRGLVCAIDDPRLRYLHQDASGISAALNHGLRRARGRYVARLDSDDVWTPDMLTTLVPILESQPEVGVVYARGQAMDASGRVLPNLQGAPERFPGDSLRSLVYDDTTCNVALVARRACFERAGLYDEGLLSKCKDWDMWLRAGRHDRFAFVDKVVARIRWHDDNLTGPGSPRLAEVLVARSCPLDKLFRDPDFWLPCARCVRWRTPTSICSAASAGCRQASRVAVRSLGSAVRTSDHRVTMLTRVVWFTVARPVLRRWATARRAMDALSDVLLVGGGVSRRARAPEPERVEKGNDRATVADLVGNAAEVPVLVEPVDETVPAPSPSHGGQRPGDENSPRAAASPVRGRSNASVRPMRPIRLCGRSISPSFRRSTISGWRGASAASLRPMDRPRRRYAASESSSRRWW